MITARTRIHGGCEHEIRRVTQRNGRARDCHNAVFHRLAQDFQDILPEFRQLIEEKNAIVSQTYFAGSRNSSASDEPGIRDRVMGTPKRPTGNQRASGPQKPCNGMNLRCLQSLLESHVGQNRGQPLGGHRFAGARWPHKQNVVPTSGRDLKGSLGSSLPANLREVADAFSRLQKEALAVHHKRLNLIRPRQKVDRIPQRLHGIDVDSLHESRFAGILLGDN